VQALDKAEVKLAMLNTQEVIDVIVSEDVDALVFGTKCVIQM
jgi:XPG I-region